MFNAGGEIAADSETGKDDARRVDHDHNIRSIMGLAGYADTVPYNDGEGEVRRFTQLVAIELARRGWTARLRRIVRIMRRQHSFPWYLSATLLGLDCHWQPPR